MQEELKICVDTDDLVCLVQKRYAVALEPKKDGDGWVVCGQPLAVTKIHGAIRRAHKSLR